MGIEVLHFVFVINYVYLAIILVRQGVRQYLLYFVQLCLAMSVSAVALAWHSDNAALVTAGGLVFLWLAIAPVLCTHLMVTSLSRRDLGRAIIYARWRYYLTRARVHAIEYSMVCCWRLISENRVAEAAEMWQRLPQHPRSRIEMAHVLYQWEVFNSEPLDNKPLPRNVPWLTLVLIAINVLFFVAVELSGGSSNLRSMLNWGANSFDFVRYNHEYWRFFTSSFLHINSIHLLLNLLALYLFGRTVESGCGKRNMLLVYTIAAVVSSCSSFYCNIGKGAVSLGASGAICGLLGLNISIVSHARRLPDPLREHHIFSLVFMIAALAAMGQIFPNVDNAAHFGGLISGLMAGMALKLKPSSPFGRSLYRLCYAAISCLTLGFVLWSSVRLTHNISQRHYPEHVPHLVWYSILRESDRIVWGMPFTWQLLDGDREISLSPDFPLDLDKDKVYYRDVYSDDMELVEQYFEQLKKFEETGRGAETDEGTTDSRAVQLQEAEDALIHLTVTVFSLRELPRSVRREWRTILREQKFEQFGTNRLGEQRRSREIQLQHDISIEERIFYFPCGDSLYRFHFCFPTAQWPIYSNSAAKILTSIRPL